MVTNIEIIRKLLIMVPVYIKIIKKIMKILILKISAVILNLKCC